MKFNIINYITITLMVLAGIEFLLYQGLTPVAAGFVSAFLAVITMHMFDLHIITEKAKGPEDNNR